MIQIFVLLFIKLSFTKFWQMSLLRPYVQIENCFPFDNFSKPQPYFIWNLDMLFMTAEYSLFVF